MSTRSLSKLFSFAQKQKVPAKPIKVQLALGTRHLALYFFSGKWISMFRLHALQ
jgi:hypothetical protein|nr:MAG TPA: hypothetical protein [Caudoviricetes sp.]